jgi:hypothetical protein
MRARISGGISGICIWIAISQAPGCIGKPPDGLDDDEAEGEEEAMGVPAAPFAASA